MATVGRVVVEIAADTAKFVQAIDKSTRKTKTWAGRLRSVAGAAVKFLGAQVALAATAISGLAIAGVRLGDEMAKTARKLGVATDALQGLRFAGQQTGVEVRQMDLGIQRMTRRIAEAAQGTGEAQGALRELGLDASRLAQLSVDQQFLEIADAMEEVTSGSDRVRLGFKLFDSEGVALINTLGAGREALEDFYDRAQELGLFLDSTQTRVVEEAADSMGEMKAAVQGLSLQLGAGFGPAITTATEFVTDWIAKVTQSIEPMVVFLEKVTGIRREMDNVSLRGLEARADSLWGELADQIDATLRAQKELDAAQARGRAVPALRSTEIDAEREAQQALNESLDEEDRIRAAIEDVEKRIVQRRKDEAEATREAAQSYDELASSMKNVETQRLRSLPTLGPEPIFDVAPSLEDMWDMTPLERSLMGVGETAAETSARIRDSMQDAADAANDARGPFENFGQVITNHLDFAIQRGQKLRDVIGDLMRDLLSFAIRAQVVGFLGAQFPKVFGDGVSTPLALPRAPVIPTSPGQVVAVAGPQKMFHITQENTFNGGDPADISRQIAEANDRLKADLMHESSRGRF